MLNNLRKEIESLKNPLKAKILQRFFKTGEGQYGEGDIFYGIMVPESRKLVNKYYTYLNLEDIQFLLKSKIHEERLIGAFCLVKKYDKGDLGQKKIIFEFYLANIYGFNNWDLVDLSAPNIVGSYLRDFANSELLILDELAISNNLWERRISILSTFAFIKKNNFTDAIRICEMLLKDSHDLIHKSTGWMLREIGKRDENVLIDFLNKNISKMPRTMLRYAIEKFSPEKRKYYLSL